MTAQSLLGRVVLVTGASHGIGQALVEEALKRGAGKVYAGTRQLLAHDDPRVAPLFLDITAYSQIRAAAEWVGPLDLLVNNAGTALFDDLSDPSLLEQHLAVNLFGPYAVTQAFLPKLAESKGTIVNNMSMMALAPFPPAPSCELSKDALLNWTRSLRALVAEQGIHVHAVVPGSTSSSPETVAAAIFEGVDRGEEDIFPDEFAAPFAPEAA